jgi:hypothetical protein
MPESAVSHHGEREPVVVTLVSSDHQRYPIHQDWCRHSGLLRSLLETDPAMEMDVPLPFKGATLERCIEYMGYMEEVQRHYHPHDLHHGEGDAAVIKPFAVPEDPAVDVMELLRAADFLRL